MKRPDKSLEKILIRSEKQGEIITIETSSEILTGFSYQEENYSIISDNSGSFVCYFLHNETVDTNHYLIGFWNSSKFHFRYKNLPNSGRIIICPIRTVTEKNQPSLIESVSANSLTTELDNYDLIEGIYKYFYPRKNKSTKSGHENSNGIKKEDIDKFNEIHKQIESVSNTLTKEVENLKGVTTRINLEIEDLKANFLKNFKIEGVYNELKLLVAKGETKKVFDELKEFFSPKREKKIYNSYMLLFARFTNLKNSKNNGTISYDNASNESNRINLALLNLIDEIEEINPEIKPKS